MKLLPVLLLLALSGCCTCRKPVIVTATPVVVTRTTIEHVWPNYRIYHVRPGCTLPSTVFRQVAKIPGVNNSSGGDQYSIGVTKAPQFRWEKVEPVVLNELHRACKEKP